ncbi:hypothetical protein [Leucobacter sp. W1478]|uniref:hypothetical protein n=1 Tax=Leucobacter sp. W1478 TaxID=3439065 RepID=UPI003F3DD71D
MNSLDPFISPTHAADHFVSTLGLMRECQERNLISEHGAAEAKLMESISQLERDGNKASGTLGVLAQRLVAIALERAAEGDPALLTEMADETVTADPIANYFLALHFRAAWAGVGGDEAERRDKVNVMLVSHQNLESDPRGASRAVRALAAKLSSE